MSVIYTFDANASEEKVKKWLSEVNEEIQAILINSEKLNNSMHIVFNPKLKAVIIGTNNGDKLIEGTESPVDSLLVMLMLASMLDAYDIRILQTIAEKAIKKQETMNIKDLMSRIISTNDIIN